MLKIANMFYINERIFQNGSDRMNGHEKFLQIRIYRIQFDLNNKTQKYLRYLVQIYCGCSASITFYE